MSTESNPITSVLYQNSSALNLNFTQVAQAMQQEIVSLKMQQPAFHCSVHANTYTYIVYIKITPMAMSVPRWDPQ